MYLLEEDFELKSPAYRKIRRLSGDIPDDVEQELNGLKILLVDDNKMNRLMGKQILSRAGCSPVVADNGEEAFVLLEEKGPFDIILMDCYARPSYLHKAILLSPF